MQKKIPKRDNETQTKETVFYKDKEVAVRLRFLAEMIVFFISKDEEY